MGHPALPLPGNALCSTLSTQREPAQPCLALAMGHPALPLPGGSNALRCTATSSIQREPSHALRCSWGHPAPNGMWGHPTFCGVTQLPQLPLAWGHKCSCWWLGTGAPQWCWWLALHPAASGMGPPNSKRCGVTQLFVGPVPPNSPSCHWHRATNAYAGGLALVHHYCAST